MRILTFVPTVELTSEARLALDFAGEARAQGHDPLLLGLIKTAGAPGGSPLGEAADARAVNFRLIQQRFAIDPGVLGQMEVILGRFRPDVYQSLGIAGTLLSRPAFARGIVWQACLHGRGFLDPASGMTERIRRRFALAMFRRAEQVVADDPAAADDLAARGIKRERLVLLQGEEANGNMRVILENAERLCKR